MCRLTEIAVVAWRPGRPVTLRCFGSVHHEKVTPALGSLGRVGVGERIEV